MPNAGRTWQKVTKIQVYYIQEILPVEMKMDFII